MSGFVQMFDLGGDEDPPEEPDQPGWFGPPEDELGIAVALNLVVGRSERGAVALTRATSFSNGLTLSFLVQARDLDQRTAQTLFHDQHPFRPGGADLPDGFLRLGVELPGGAKAANIGRPQPFPEGDPEGPVFIHRGGGGGQGRRDRVTMNNDYWVWPLPRPGTIRVSCEWPLVGISLSTVDVDGAPLTEAASRVLSLWRA